MGKAKKYTIPFVGLTLGKHLYEYDLEDSFFEDIEYSEVKKGKIKVAVGLNKQSTMLIIDFSIHGTVNVPCDRCNEDFDLPIEGKYQIVVKIGGEEISDTNEDLITISSTDSEIKLNKFIYEYIILSLPFKRVHPDDKKGNSTCDAEVLKKLAKLSVKEDKQQPLDPRWDALKNIKLN